MRREIVCRHGLVITRRARQTGAGGGSALDEAGPAWTTADLRRERARRRGRAA